MISLTLSPSILGRRRRDGKSQLPREKETMASFAYAFDRSIKDILFYLITIILHGGSEFDANTKLTTARREEWKPLIKLVSTRNIHLDEIPDIDSALS